MIAFMRGTRTPVFTTAMPSSARTASKAAVYLLSRSRIRYFMVAPASCRSMTRFLASCVVQAAVGWAVAPRTRTRRVACSMTAKTYSRAPVRVRVSKKSAARIACAWLRRKAAQVWRSRSGRGLDPVGLEDLPDRGGGDLDPEGGQLAVDSPVAPARVLPGQAQDEGLGCCERWAVGRAVSGGTAWRGGGGAGRGASAGRCRGRRSGAAAAAWAGVAGAGGRRGTPGRAG